MQVRQITLFKVVMAILELITGGLPLLKDNKNKIESIRHSLNCHVYKGAMAFFIK